MPALPRILAGGVLTAGLLAVPGTAAAEPVPAPTIQRIPGALPGDPEAPDVGGTYPWMSTTTDLASAGYVEQEFSVTGKADAYSVSGAVLASDVPYKTRVIIRRPLHFDGTVLAEWQNVSAGFDLDALWSPDQIMRDRHAWAGISAQRVGVDHLRQWSPARYGDLDVTGNGRFTRDELSYDIYAQTAKAVRNLLDARTVLGVGASQSAGRMTVYYDAVLPKSGRVFDAYAFVVGPAPSRKGPEPVLHILSETDVRSPDRRPDDPLYRRWEVAGTAHSGWHGQEYRRPILDRDLGEAPTYDCTRPPFSRVPMHHVIAAAYRHLIKWTHGHAPPSAPPLKFNPDGTKARDELGLALGGIRLSQQEVPTALNTGDNTGETFCVLFGTHVPFTQAQLDELYPSHGRYVAKVSRTDVRNVRKGYLLMGDALDNLRAASRSDIGQR